MIYSQTFEDGVNYLSNYILSDEYEYLTQTIPDINLVDSIYCKALTYYNGDISEALLAAAFATLAFKELPLKLPIIGSSLKISLMDVDDEIFNEKISRLPSKLFFDSPQNNFGDLDKLSHFFGSAYLSHSVTIFKLSKFMGIFVEAFEAAFKVDGYLDGKDLLIDNLGEFYGKALKKNPGLLPSSSFKLYNLLFFKITN